MYIYNCYSDYIKEYNIYRDINLRLIYIKSLNKPIFYKNRFVVLTITSITENKNLIYFIR